MRYQVPQFIEVEDKLFGPLTFRQTVYMVGGVALAYLAYLGLKSFLPFFIILVVVSPIIILGIGLAFYKVNSKPLIDVIEAALKYTFGKKLYIWKKEAKPIAQIQAEQNDSGLFVPKLSQSKLKDMAWSLDVTSNTNPVNPTDQDKLWGKMGFHIDLGAVEHLHDKMIVPKKEYNFSSTVVKKEEK
jgi:hypothetical protein